MESKSSIISNIIERRNEKKEKKYIEIKNNILNYFSELDKNRKYYPTNIKQNIKTVISIYNIFFEYFDLFIWKHNSNIINLLKIMYNKSLEIKEDIRKFIFNKNEKIKTVKKELDNIVNKIEKKSINYVFQNFFIDKHILNDKKDCPICLEEINKKLDIIVINCNHYFHKNCLFQYIMLNNNNCPICRKDILNF